MNEYTPYLIAVGAVLVSILTIYFSVKIYKKKKRALEAEIEIAHENLRRKEIETQNKLNQMEQSANDRIRAAENELHRRTEEFNGRVDQFNKEQKLRESLEGKSDRD